MNSRKKKKKRGRERERRRRECKNFAGFFLKFLLTNFLFAFPDLDLITHKHTRARAQRTMAASGKKREREKRKASKRAERKKARENEEGKPKPDLSIDFLRTENRERLFDFALPQPPGDPKLLEVPEVEQYLKNAHVGFLGTNLLKTVHMQSGLGRRATLPSVNLREGLQVLSFVPYDRTNGNTSKAAPMTTLDAEDQELIEKSFLNPHQGASVRKLDITDKMSWVMNTTYIADFSDPRKMVKKERAEGPARTMQVAEGPSVADIESSFESVKSDQTQHPTKKGATVVESIPIVPYKLGEYGQYVHVQLRGSTPYKTPSQCRNSILKSISIPAGEDDLEEEEEDSVVPLFLKKESDAKQDATELEEKEYYEIRKENQTDEEKGKTLLLMEKDGKLFYLLDLPRVNLTKCAQSKRKNVSESLGRYKKYISSSSTQ